MTLKFIVMSDLHLVPDAFIDALKAHPDIRQVIAGHVHLTSTASYRGLPFTTLAGGHNSVGFIVDQPTAPFRRVTGPGQMAVVLGTEDRTTVLFEDFIDGNAEIAVAPRIGRTRPRRPRFCGTGSRVAPGAVVDHAGCSSVGSSSTSRLAGGKARAMAAAATPTAAEAM
jgi:hypothetical protein